MSDNPIVPDDVDELVEIVHEIGVQVAESDARFVSFMACAEKLAAAASDDDSDEAIADAIHALVRAHYNFTSCESKIKKLEDALRGSIADTVAEAAWRATLAETRPDDETHHGCEKDPPNECTLYYVIHEAIWTTLDEALNEGKE